VADPRFFCAKSRAYGGRFNVLANLGKNPADLIGHFGKCRAEELCYIHKKVIFAKKIIYALDNLNEKC
jgi:hypothetical protein